MIVKPPQQGQPSQPAQGGRVLPKPQPINNVGAIEKIHKETPAALPKPAGAPSRSTTIINAPQNTVIVNKTINNTTIINNVTNVYNHTEINRGGYWWHDYDGYRYCHHYDEWGFHWYGFYVGTSYFWTRYYYDSWWTYDPYWGRWCYWRNGMWWWQDPYEVHVVYVYRDNYYYRYEDSGGGVVLQPKPEPTQPRQPLPNPQPQQPADEKVFYSVDGTRSIQLVGDRRDAYLYDLTVQDQSSAQARPVYLGFGVKKVTFDNQTKRTADGSTREVLRQINLVFEDESSRAVVDPNGTRKVQTFTKDAYLYDLTNQSADAKYLAGGVTDVRFETVERQDQNGYYRQDLRFIELSVMDENNNETLMLLDPDGNAINGAAAVGTSSVEPAVLPAPVGPSASERLEKSSLFNALKAGSIGWQ